MNGNSNLLEPGERTLAHSTGEEDLHARLFQELNGGHAAALLVAGILEDGDFADLPVLDSNDGERTAVTEVFGDLGIKASRSVGWDCNQHRSSFRGLRWYSHPPTVSRTTHVGADETRPTR